MPSSNCHLAGSMPPAGLSNSSDQTSFHGERGADAGCDAGCEAGRARTLNRADRVVAEEGRVVVEVVAVVAATRTNKQQLTHRMSAGLLPGPGLCNRNDSAA